jgi:hypothetical protein
VQTPPRATNPTFADLVADPARVTRAVSRRTETPRPQRRSVPSEISPDVQFTASLLSRRLGITQADLVETLLRILLSELDVPLESPPSGP